MVRELRLVVTADDYDEALRFYRDVLGLPERAAFSSPGGRVTILEAGRATLEITDPPHAEYIDQVEVGRRVAGHIRVAFEVDDSTATTRELERAGADRRRRADPHAVELAQRPAGSAGRAPAHAVHRVGRAHRARAHRAHRARAHRARRVTEKGPVRKPDRPLTSQDYRGNSSR